MSTLVAKTTSKRYAVIVGESDDTHIINTDMKLDKKIKQLVSNDPKHVLKYVDMSEDKDAYRNVVNMHVCDCIQL